MIKKNIFSLDNKVIVVTGGTGVLGGHFVNAIVQAGGIVIILGLNEERGNAQAEEIKLNGGEAIFLKVNVLDEWQLVRAKERIIQKYGKIDGLVNAAGGNVPEGILNPDDDVFNLNIDGMKEAMEVNLWGTIIPNQVFGPTLAKTENGAIVNISSVGSKRALTRVLGYSMGKASIDYYTKWFAVEMANRYGDSIRINSIAPGFFLSEQNRSLLTNPDGSYTSRADSILRQTPFKRFGKPEELSGALVWLLSDASKFVTGMDIGVDGGFTINSGV
ncbi:SDR family oxidoreductase [Flavobacterium sp. ZT3R17]|uniref:SDR family oxidoreductase n=1 Tax=Flavobacterium cryoconiti TaxID=3398736 RepID=UPI003A89DF1C